MLRAVAAGADECTVLSEAAADPFRRYLLREPRVLPPGVLTERVRSRRRARQSATFFCPASLGDPRKRGELLPEPSSWFAGACRRPGYCSPAAGIR